MKKRWKKKNGLYVPDTGGHLYRAPFNFNLQRFAQVFNADGEDAGSTPWEWTAVSATSGNSFALDAAAKKLGTYGYKASHGGTTTEAYGYKDFSADADLWIGLHLFISTGYDLGAAWSQQDTIVCEDNNGDDCFNFMLGSETTTGATWWVISTYNGTQYSGTSTNFSTNAWHWITIHNVRSATVGGTLVKVDGTTIFNDMDNNNTAINSPQRLMVGAIWCGQAQNSGDYLYLDNVIIDDTSEPTEPTDVATLDQEGFRFRYDNGDESAAVWAEDQDANMTAPKNINKRLRFLINATGDPTGKQFQLEYKKSTEGTYKKVT